MRSSPLKLMAGRSYARSLARCCRPALLTPHPTQSGALRQCSSSSSGGGGGGGGGPQQHIVESLHPGHLPTLTGNYAVNLLRNAHKWQDKVAMECSMSGARTTYGQLTDQVARWGGYLHKVGLGKGDVVAVISPNLNEYAPVIYGSAAVGVITTGINPTYTPDEIAYQLADSNTRLVVVFGPIEEILRKALALMGKDIPIVSIGPNTGTGLPQVQEILQDDRIHFADPVEVAGSDVLAFMYSSGTTGKPKGAMLTHDGAFCNIGMVTHPSFLPYSTFVEGDKQGSMLQLLPMFHVGGMFSVNAVGIQGGARMVNYAKFEPATFLKVLHDFKVTELPVVPAVLNFMVAHPGCTAQTLQYVQSILCGTAPLSDTALRLLLKKVDRPVVFQQAYGMTELLFATMDPIGKGKNGYTGMLVPSVQGKVLDLEDGVTTLPHGVDGEICIKSDSTMLGYLNRPEETATTIDSDGWLHTGDVGHYDQDGYFKITDRTKELVKVKGLQVSPSEIEDVLLQIPDVVEAGVVGVPHPRLGEAPRAYLVTRTKSNLKEEEVSAFVAKKLAPYKQLVGGIKFISSLPRTSTGKILKRELVAQAKEETSS